MYSLHEEKASTFENTTVLPCLSTGATVLPAHSRSLCLPPTTSLTSITSQQAGEATWTYCLYQLHKLPCATGHSSGGWGCAFQSHMDYMLLSVFKHIRNKQGFTPGKEQVNTKLKKQLQNLTFNCSLLWAVREPVWLPKRQSNIWIPATQS